MLEAYYLQRTRFESIAERKLRRRQLTEDGNVEDQRAGLTLSCRWETVPPAGGASQIDLERSVVAAHAAVSLRCVGWRFQPSLAVCQCSPSKWKSQPNSIQFQNR